MQDASFGNFPPPPTPPTLQGSFGAEKKRDLGNKFSQFFFFFEGGEKGVESQAAWLRAFKQIKNRIDAYPQGAETHTFSLQASLFGTRNLKIW